MLLIGNLDICRLNFTPCFFPLILNLSLIFAAPVEKEFEKDNLYSQECGLVCYSDVYSLDNF